MEFKNKKVSVLMTVFNAEEYLEESIQSVLSQTHKDFELIIVDDFSNDSSKRIIKNFVDERIKFFSLSKKIGRTKALNFGLEKCNSKFIAIQDADDISHPERLFRCFKSFEQDEKIGLIGTNFSYINSTGKDKYDIHNFFDRNLKNIKFFNCIPHSSVIFKRDHFEKEIFYDESYVYAQDYHLILKFLKYSKIVLLNENLVQIRVHMNNMSNKKEFRKIRIEENIRLLDFSAKNFKLNFYDRKKILFYKFKNYLKKLILTILN